MVRTLGFQSGNVGSIPTSFTSGIVAKLPRNPERTTALRKLLEAKDCAVRSIILG